MPNWTKEQQEAIETSGTNIIVSAGAGSGKTAVLTERVITKLKQNINVNQLLVLTFTNEAAQEMKERIRTAIKKIPSLEEQLNYLDSAYITTFDSYSLSIVKKYHYILNISKNIKNLDQSIINIKQEEFIEEIFEKKYQEQNEEFITLINAFCYKDDSELKNLILGLSQSLDLKINKEQFLNDYIDNYYKEENINKFLEEYQAYILKKITKLEKELNNLLIYSEGKYYEQVINLVTKLLESKTYEEIKENCDITLPRLYKNCDEETKKIKKEISETIEDIKENTEYQTLEEIKQNLLTTKTFIKPIIDIIKELDQKWLEYKNKNEAYSFNDIAKMAIKIVKENPEIKEEILSSFKEIMIDEYQDTSDIQEEFISLINNNNTYMVGDIKQSIYRFRNANPDIFKNKYKNYSNGNKGVKIDLLKNFRSRKEVLDNINEIFKLIMDESIGGADYVKTHQMIFGNQTYDENKIEKQDYNLKILNYYYEDKKYSKEEIEIFTIANDIKNKINNKYQVLDKKTNTLRNINYNDFCIIMDRGSEFDKYKKIFEYLSIPLSIYQDEKLTNEDDIYVLKNIIGLILKIKDKNYDKEFKHFFISIARSYLFNYKDEDIFKIFKENTFYKDEIYIKCQKIIENIEYLTNRQLLEKIIEEFNIYEKLITIGNIEKCIIRLDNILNISDNLTDLGYTKQQFFDYINHMINSNQDIKYTIKQTNTNSVKIMNIHKSKGLEFPICYYSGLHKKFNTKDVEKKIIYDEKYGIIIPFYNNDSLEETILKKLLKEKYNKEEISEKIRLFYVALTRCKEQMIIVTSLNDNKTNTMSLVEDEKRLSYKSFLDILNSITTSLDKYIENIDIEKLNLTKAYNFSKEINYKNTQNTIQEKLIIKENKKDESIEEETNYSKKVNKLITKKEYNELKYGTEIHQLLEETNVEEVFNEINKKIDLTNTKIYKEHEFIYTKDNTKYHGIIDLMIEDKQNIYIIDYKLKNIKDENYIKQISGYKEYIKTKTNKNVKTYLYSILDKTLEEIYN